MEFQLSPLITSRTTQKNVYIIIWLFSAFLLALTTELLLVLLFPSVSAAHSVKLTGTDKGQLKSLRQTKLKEICLFASVWSLGSGHFAFTDVSNTAALSAALFPELCCYCSFPLFSCAFVSFLFFPAPARHGGASSASSKWVQMKRRGCGLDEGWGSSCFIPVGMDAGEKLSSTQWEWKNQRNTGSTSHPTSLFTPQWYLHCIGWLGQYYMSTCLGYLLKSKLTLKASAFFCKIK